ncbi:unnamed protein product [Nesidiocoris tenuis]|uniref:K Homology domain-containing protein n=1 Tax=Nesidiocoris tenuis TaxID=355587 RepID=A0A6H5HGE5_9HEMI|nr:unnamed protein product [Nesidiocoris tenuis]
MSDFANSLQQPQQSSNNSNFPHSTGFAAALERAKQIAAKITPAGAVDAKQKRPLDDSQEPEAKKLAPNSPNRSSVGGGGVGVLGLGLGGGAGGGGIAPPPSALMAGGGALMAAGGVSGPVSSEDIKVPDKMVGLIIGRGGEQITRLQSESGCKIQMAPDSGGLPDRICTLTGGSQAISRAKELINAIVHQRYKSEGPSMHEMGQMQPQHGGGGVGVGGGGGAGGPGGGNSSFVEVMIPGAKVGLVIGKGGETIKMLQEKSGAKMVVIQDGPNQEAEKPLRITGDPQKVEHARQLVYELLAEKEQRGGGGRGGAGGGGGRGGFGGGGRGGFNNRGGGGDESTFVVPAAKCGVIIGRGGETIKQINQTSGAHCELDRRPNDNPNEKIFIIRGSPQQIETAKQMIADKLGQAGAGGPGGPTNGQPGGFGGGGGGGGGGYPGQWGGPQGPAYHQPFHQQHMNPGAMGMPAQNAGQPDYSQQWIEYYRNLGMHQEADAIEQQTKAKFSQYPKSPMPGKSRPGNFSLGRINLKIRPPLLQQAAAAQGGAPGVGQVPGGLAQAAPSAAAPAPNAAAPGGGAQNGAPDYSAQWAQYYRSIGKIKEAELIEAQMKNKVPTVGVIGSTERDGTESVGGSGSSVGRPLPGVPGSDAVPGVPAYGVSGLRAAGWRLPIPASAASGSRLGRAISSQTSSSLKKNGCLVLVRLKTKTRYTSFPIHDKYLIFFNFDETISYDVRKIIR